MVGLAHISKQPFCFLSIWFNLVTYCVTTPWTTEKRDLSSAKSLIVDDKPDHQHTSRSSTYIKKNKGTMIDPWEATAQTPFNRVYHITNDLILDINLSSQALSKTLRLLYICTIRPINRIVGNMQQIVVCTPSHTIA